MTKKRYKKLLRMRGYSKYAAEQIANNEWQKGISYQESYDSWIRRLYIFEKYKLLPAWQEIVKGVTKACQRITTKMDKITHSLTEVSSKERLLKEPPKSISPVSEKES